jgi:hypothetical protein
VHHTPFLRVATLVLGGLMFLAAGLVAARPPITFDHSPAGAPPDGFFFAAARQANAGLWEVRGDGTRKHLVHAADPTVTMRGISVAGIATAAPADLKIGTRLRLLDGDRAGGTMWRYQDSGNFYLMSLVLGTRTASLFRVTGGNRIQLDTIANVNVDLEAWHTVSVVHERDQIRATLNGIEILRARDGTLTDGGRAGVWSGGNSTSWFDDITLDDYPE